MKIFWLISAKIISTRSSQLLKVPLTFQTILAEIRHASPLTWRNPATRGRLILEHGPLRQGGPAVFLPLHASALSGSRSAPRGTFPPDPPLSDHKGNQ